MDVSVVYVESNRMSQRKKTVIDMLRESRVSSPARRSATASASRATRCTSTSSRCAAAATASSGCRAAATSSKRSRAASPWRAITEQHEAAAPSGVPSATTTRSNRPMPRPSRWPTAARPRARWSSPSARRPAAGAWAGAGPRRRARACSSRWSCAPPLAMSDAYLLTLVAAAAAAEGIEAAGGVRVQIKWPNDLFIDDRKAGGILMEVAGEQDEVEWVVVGIGLNVNTEYSELPVALRRTATSLKMATGHAVDRSELLARVLLGLETQLRRGRREGLRECPAGVPRPRLPAAAKRQRADSRRARSSDEATGIDERGALLVELAQRQIRRFHSGDVTLHH